MVVVGPYTGECSPSPALSFFAKILLLSFLVYWRSMTLFPFPKRCVPHKAALSSQEKPLLLNSVVAKRIFCARTSRAALVFFRCSSECELLFSLFSGRRPLFG